VELRGANGHLAEVSGHRKAIQACPRALRNRGYTRSRKTRDDSPVLFELDSVSASRGGKVVLAGVSVGIAEGATCIVGPSGAGKSTLLRLLNRLSDPDAGTVRYRGRPVRDLDVLALRREVGLVPQLPALLPGTVADNVRYGARLGGREPDVDRLLDIVGLSGAFATRPAVKLSVGEQQRVMLARALALEPRALLLDEPTSGLDEETKLAVEKTLLQLRERLGLSFVFVTHDRLQCRRLSDRVIVLRDGSLNGGPEGRAPAA
jgi:putative ABC transport system ATP-binding protein